MTIQVGGSAATATQITQIKTDLGLSNVNDTPDSAKPVSEPQAAAIAAAVAGKADAAVVATALAAKADAASVAAASTAATNASTSAAAAAASAAAATAAVAGKADAVTASPVVPTATTTLTRTAATGAPTGHFNRLLHIDGNKTVNTANSVAGDGIAAYNTSASPVTVTIDALTLTIQPAKIGEAMNNGSAFVDVSGTAAQAGLAEMSVTVPAGTTYSITRALHLGKRVQVTAATGVTVVVEVAAGQGWVDGDSFEIVQAGTVEFGLRSSTYAGLLPVDNKILAGENTFIRYRHNGLKFEAVDASFILTGGPNLLRKSAVWFGDPDPSTGAASQCLHYSGKNMDWYIGQALDVMQCNLGGHTFYGGPSEAIRSIATTIYKAKPSGFPSYGQSARPHWLLGLGYYEDPQQDKLLLEIAQSGTHNTDASRQGANPLATDQGERNWMSFRGAPLTFSVIPPNEQGNPAYLGAWSGMCGDVHETGNLVWRRGFGVSSEQVDSATGSHALTVADGVSNLLLNGGGTVAITLPTVPSIEASRDLRVSVLVAYAAVSFIGTTAALGAIPVTAGSFITLRWSPTLSAWHRIG